MRTCLIEINASAPVFTGGGAFSRLSLDQSTDLDISFREELSRGEFWLFIVPLTCARISKTDLEPGRLASLFRELRSILSPRNFLACIVLGVDFDQRDQLAWVESALQNADRTRLLCIMDRYRDDYQKAEKLTGGPGVLERAVDIQVDLLLSLEEKELQSLLAYEETQVPVLASSIGLKAWYNGADLSRTALGFAAVQREIRRILGKECQADMFQSGAKQMVHQLEQKCRSGVRLESPPEMPDFEIMEPVDVHLKWMPANDKATEEKASPLDRFGEFVSSFRKQGVYLARKNCETLFKKTASDSFGGLASYDPQPNEVPVESYAASVFHDLEPAFENLEDLGIRARVEICRALADTASEREMEIGGNFPPRQPIKGLKPKGPDGSKVIEEAQEQFSDALDQRPSFLPVWIWTLAGLLCGGLLTWLTFTVLDGFYQTRYRLLQPLLTGGCLGLGVYYLIVVARKIFALFSRDRKRFLLHFKFKMGGLIPLSALGVGMFTAWILRERMMGTGPFQIRVFSIALGFFVFLLFFMLGSFRYTKKWIAWRKNLVDPFLQGWSKTLQEARDRLEQEAEPLADLYRSWAVIRGLRTLHRHALREQVRLQQWAERLESWQTVCEEQSDARFAEIAGQSESSLRRIVYDPHHLGRWRKIAAELRTATGGVRVPGGDWLRDTLDPVREGEDMAVGLDFSFPEDSLRVGTLEVKPGKFEKPQGVHVSDSSRISEAIHGTGWKAHSKYPAEAATCSLPDRIYGECLKTMPNLLLLQAYRDRWFPWTVWREECQRQHRELLGEETP